MGEHHTGQDVFRSVLPPDVVWQPFAAFPPAARLAVVVGDVSRPEPFVVRVKLPAGERLMPHRHHEDRVYTVISGVFYIGLGDEGLPAAHPVPAGHRVRGGRGPGLDPEPDVINAFVNV